MTLPWSNEETFQFIDLYQSEPVIWDSTNKLHKDRNEVNEAWNRIADSLQIPISKLKKKKESLMASFRFHFKKKQDTIRFGLGEAEIYKPIWVFYDAMEAFLKDKYECKGISSTGGQSNSLPLGQKANAGEEEDQESEIPCGTRSNTKTNHNNIKIRIQRRRSVNPSKSDKAEKEMSKAFNTLNQVILKKDQQNEKEDDCELYGKLLANKLRKYSENERQEIMYEIDGLLLRRRRKCSPL